MAFDPTTDYITRYERYLAVMAGAKVSYPDPITREEKFLAAMCDASKSAPDPITRYENFLSAIAARNGKLVKTEEVEANTTSTTAAKIKTITLPDNVSSIGNILYIRIRDKAGVRNGYVYGSDNYAMSGLSTPVKLIFKGDSNVIKSAGSSGYGVYINSTSVSSNKFASVDVYQRYNSSYGTINGTFTVEVYVIPIS